MVSMKVTITGTKELQAAINKIRREAPQDLEWITNKGAQSTRDNAVKSIQSHLSKGKTYLRGTKTHTASAAGFPPNTDTGNLVRNVTKEKVSGGYDAGSRKGAGYGYWLEFGTSKIKPRPWLKPAYDAAIAKLLESIKARYK